MNGMLRALDYLSFGWGAMPCLPGSKAPATSLIRRQRGTSSWKTFERKHATPDEVADWAERLPEHNVAVICGETSGNLAVLDDDDGLPAGASVPATATVKTGGTGAHYYATSDKPVPTHRYEWGELRGEGSYVVAPQSVHPNGRRYEWVSTPDEGIAPLDEFELPLASRAEASHPLHTESGLLGFTGLATWHSAENAHAYAAVLGLPFERLGANFLCVLHPEEHPSATLWPRRRSGQLAYHDFHAQREWVSLPTLLAWLAGCPHESLTPSAYVTWAKRLDIEAGLVAPAPVPLGDLPPTCRTACASSTTASGVSSRRAGCTHPASPRPSRLASALSGAAARGQP